MVDKLSFSEFSHRVFNRNKVFKERLERSLKGSTPRPWLPMGENMRLRQLAITNFRGYSTRTELEIGDFTSIIGRNDVGKSTLLEALEIFFNNSTVKVDSSDVCVKNTNKVIEIECAFDDLPEEIIIDSKSKTTVADEHLLGQGGLLRIVKQIDCTPRTPKVSVFASALFPAADGVRDLLSLKQADLKKRAESLGADLQAVDKRSNVELRRAIYTHVKELFPEPQLVPMDAEEGKKVWEQLQKFLPSFALFQADRPNKVDDSEVQDPMKLAVQEAIKSVEEELESIREKVRAQATEVAERTLEKLKDMAPELAAELQPNFKAEPKWDGFKLTLADDNGIPIDKRGSGVRRLILLNFFRAEAERRQESSGSPNIIYAVEEPENSQHPSNQVMLIKALRNLVDQGDAQVIVTTHVPAIARLLPIEAIRYISRSKNSLVPTVRHGSDEVLAEVAKTLGVLPDGRVRVLLCVEGPTDVDFLSNIADVLRPNFPIIPHIEDDPRIGIIMLSGGNLKHWVDRRYLERLSTPQMHIYDRDDNQPPQYEAHIQKVINDGHWGCLTKKREIENYLHPQAIRDAMNVEVEFGDLDDVPALVAEQVHAASESTKAWVDVSEHDKKQKVSKVKRRLNSEAAKKMTPELLDIRDPDGEILGWFADLVDRLADVAEQFPDTSALRRVGNK
ncbi:ATP-binding protein [Azospirillum sp. Marseille-Q6669]